MQQARFRTHLQTSSVNTRRIRASYHPIYKVWNFLFLLLLGMYNKDIGLGKVDSGDLYDYQAITTFRATRRSLRSINTHSIARSSYARSISDLTMWDR